MSELEQNLRQIQSEKINKIIPDNIRAGVQIFDVVGTVEIMDSTDATATQANILEGKTAYIKGGKVEGTMPNIGVKEITPSINATKTDSVNGYVTNVKTPSIKTSITNNSLTNMVSTQTVGSNAATTLTALINANVGCRVLAIVSARGGLTVSEGWELSQTYVISPSDGEMWYQTTYVYERLAETEIETFTATQTEVEPLFITMMSFDTSVQMEVVWSSINTTELIQNVTLTASLKKDDIVFVNHLQGDVEKIDHTSDIILCKANDYGELADATKYITTESEVIPLLTTFKLNQAIGGYSWVIRSSVPTEMSIFVLRHKAAFSPENIRANVKILDIIGTLVDNSDSDVKEYLTVADMNASTGNQEGDFALIIDEDRNFKDVYQYTSSVWVKKIIGTDDANAAVTDIANGKTAYVDGQKITGTIPIVTGIQNDTIPAVNMGQYGGYIYGHAKPAGRTGAQTTIYRAASTLNVRMPQADVAAVAGLTSDIIKKDTRVLGVTGTFEGTNTSDATATSGDIMEGKSAYVGGQKIIGTVAPITNMDAGIASSAYVPADDLTKLTLNTTITQRGILGQNLPYQLSANGSQVTKAIGLSPEILKKGISILGMEGTFDSNPDAYNAKFETGGRTEGLTPLTMLVAIDKIDTANVTNASSIFTQCTSLKSLPKEMNLDAATVALYMCSNCYNLMSANLSIPQMKNISSMFYCCNNISSIILRNSGNVTNINSTFFNTFNMAKVADMNYQKVSVANSAYASSGLNGVIDLSEWSKTGYGSTATISYTATFSNCRNITSIQNFHASSTYNYLYMSSTFNNCTNLQTVVNCNFYNTRSSNYMFYNCQNLLGFDNCYFSNRYYNDYTYCSFSSMFAGCTNLLNVPNGLWDNELKGGAFQDMFRECHNLPFPTELNFNIMNTYYGSLQNTFINCYQIHSLNLNIRGSQYRAGTSLNNTFQGCHNLESIYITGWNCINSFYPFHNCHNLTQIAFNNVWGQPNVYGLFWGTGISSINNVTGWNYMNSRWVNGMFGHCYNLTDIGTGELNFYRTDRFDSMFTACNNLVSVPYTAINVNNGLYFTAMFNGCSNIRYMNDWHLPKAIVVSNMFANCTNLIAVNNFSCPLINSSVYMFYNCRSLQSFTGENWTKLIYANNMFQDCTNLISVNNITCPIVNNGRNLFSGCTNLSKVQNVSFTCSQFRYAYNVFANCKNLSLIEMNLPYVTYGEHMFSNTSGTIDFSNLQMPNLTQGDNMFRFANNIGGFGTLNLPNITHGSYMFANTNNVKDLDKLNLPKLTYGDYMFMGTNNLQGLNNISLPNLYSASQFLGYYQGEEIPDISLPTVYSLQYAFYSSANLQNIGNLNCPNINSLSGFIQNCYNLRSIGSITADKINYVYNIFTTGNVNTPNFDNLTDFGGLINLGKGYTYKSTNRDIYCLNIKSMPNLTAQSVKNIVTNLYNLYVTYNSTSYRQNIQLYDTQYNYLTTDEINNARNKGWYFNITNIT